MLDDAKCHCQRKQTTAVARMAISVVGRVVLEPSRRRQCARVDTTAPIRVLPTRPADPEHTSRVPADWGVESPHRCSRGTAGVHARRCSVRERKPDDQEWKQLGPIQGPADQVLVDCGGRPPGRGEGRSRSGNRARARRTCSRRGRTRGSSPPPRHRSQASPSPLNRTASERRRDTADNTARRRIAHLSRHIRLSGRPTATSPCSAHGTPNQCATTRRPLVGSDRPVGIPGPLQGVAPTVPTLTSSSAASGRAVR